MTRDDAAGRGRDDPEPAIATGYNVWFGLQHVTGTGFRHSGRREQCPKCNPRAVEMGTDADPIDEPRPDQR